MNYSKLATDKDGNGSWPDDNYVLTKEPTSYVTIDYHDGSVPEKPVTGSLKIVVLDEKVSIDRADNAIFADNGGFQGKGVWIKIQDTFNNVYHTITQTDTSEMPVIWRSALHQFAEWKCGNTSNKGEKVWGCESQESIAVVKHVKQLYDNLKKAMPGLMSYRFQNEIFSEFTNMNKKSVVDYSDEENTIIAKAIPIMEVTKIKDAFKSSFKGGNF